MQKEKITRTKEQEAKIIEFIIDCGFDNIAQFGKAIGMERQNVWARIKGKTDPDVRMLLKWAVVLGCQIDDLIALFYPSEWKEYNS
jgi:transcriptional regulator with XRE-family HTH domain